MAEARSRLDRLRDQKQEQVEKKERQEDRLDRLRSDFAKIRYEKRVDWYQNSSTESHTPEQIIEQIINTIHQLENSNQRTIGLIDRIDSEIEVEETRLQNEIPERMQQVREALVRDNPAIQAMELREILDETSEDNEKKLLGSVRQAVEAYRNQLSFEELRDFDQALGQEGLTKKLGIRELDNEFNEEKKSEGYKLAERVVVDFADKAGDYGDLQGYWDTSVLPEINNIVPTGLSERAIQNLENQFRRLAINRRQERMLVNDLSREANEIFERIMDGLDFNAGGAYVSAEGVVNFQAIEAEIRSQADRLSPDLSDEQRNLIASKAIEMIPVRVKAELEDEEKRANSRSEMRIAEGEVTSAKFKRIVDAFKGLGKGLAGSLPLGLIILIASIGGPAGLAYGPAILGTLIPGGLFAVGRDQFKERFSKERKMEQRDSELAIIAAKKYKGEMLATDAMKLRREGQVRDMLRKYYRDILGPIETGMATSRIAQELNQNAQGVRNANFNFATA
ncbi:hypothetical protein KC717_04345 [Candidatus Dojkabacteria bacterium]|uniref:Uncharacterized protein n=1 Tax=Candidatus Dojkabacteria bacterium TaxID=2099670 RepID=A0A955L8W1_9BACT|nr:hypothetical protein [Candidatus Dojkabacteria bacterium]